MNNEEAYYKNNYMQNVSVQLVIKSSSKLPGIKGEFRYKLNAKK